MARGIPIYIDDRKIPTFHPIHRREDGVWYPSNEAASLLVHISHVWDDILTLKRIMQDREDETERRLLFKYILIELHSILNPLSRLHTIVMKATERKKGQPPPYRSISSEEKEIAKKLFKAHNVAKNRIESEISDIRNDIGAHRGLQPWDRVIRLWDSLETSRFVELLETIPPVFNFAKDLDLYDWSRIPEEGGIEILGPRLYPEDFEPEENRI
jgi:hypothetical protein